MKKFLRGRRSRRRGLKARGGSGLRPAPLKNNLLELEITVGHYSGIKLEPAFRAEMLLTTGRLEAPLEHISFRHPR